MHEIDEIPVSDFNAIFGSDKAKGIKRANSGEKSADEMLAMI